MDEGGAERGKEGKGGWGRGGGGGVLPGCLIRSLFTCGLKHLESS